MVQTPSIQSRRDSDGILRIALQGRWNLVGTRARTQELLRELAFPAPSDAEWDLTRIDDLDAAGATLLWRAWGGREPSGLRLRPGDEALFRNLASLPRRSSSNIQARRLVEPIAGLGGAASGLAVHSLGIVTLLGDVTLHAGHLIRRPRAIPWREISATIYRSGLQSLPITALVGFLIGIVLSYLSAEQLRNFGADSFIVGLMGIATLRELGPMLAAILNAGRSGSSMTAQIGVMRVTGELEAMSVMGISATQRLVVPKVIGQFIGLPLVVAWTNGLALVGGALGAKLQLDVPPREFFHRLPQVVPAFDLWFGICKGALFGAIVALVSCYFGLRTRPDTEGLAAATTQSVVTSLTAVLIADAILAVLFSGMGT